MTQKDYELLAEVLVIAAGRVNGLVSQGIVSRGPFGAYYGVQIVAELLSERLAETYPRFDRDKFSEASGF